MIATLSQVVRCFPHCCPSHRDRSYCGASLSVRVSRPAESSVELNSLVVLGRFEQHDPPTARRNAGAAPVRCYAVGERVSLASLRQVPGVIWVQGDAIDDASSADAITFELNGGDANLCHWEYDWKSGTSHQQRFTRHHFRAYVLAPVDGTDQRGSESWQIVGLATSPPFTFAVHRKPRVEVEQPPVSTMTSLAQRATGNIGLQVDEVDTEDDDDDSAFVGVDDALFWARRHPDAVTSSTSLALLALYCSELDASQARIQSSDVLSLLQDAPVAEHQLLFYVNHCVPQLLSGLAPPPFSSHAEPRIDTYQEPLAVSGLEHDTVADTCAQLVVFLLKSSHVRDADRFLLSEAQALDDMSPSSSAGVSAAFVRAQDVIRTAVEQFLLSQGTALDALVDDIVSRVLASAKTTADAPYLRLEPRVRQILRNTSLLGLDHFSQLLQRVAPSMDMSAASTIVVSPWNGRWICRRVDWKRLRSSRPQQGSQAETAPMLRLVGVLLILVSAFGMDIELLQQSADGEEQKTEELVVRISPLALTATSRQPTWSLPLDDLFRDAADVLPTLPFALLDLDGVQCRGCRLRQLAVQSPALEIEWRSGDAWRCSLTLEPEREAEAEVSAASRRPHRRMMTVTGRLEEGWHELHGANQDQGDDAVQWRPRWVCTSSYEALPTCVPPPNVH